MAFKDLDYIIRNVLAATEENSLNRYQTYLQFAVRGFRELSLQCSTVTKIKYIEMLDNKAIDLPMDYVKYLKIGIVINGHVVILGSDPTLALNEDYSACGDPLEIAMNSDRNTDLSFLNFGYWWTNGFHNGQYVGGIYGLGGGYNKYGYYRVNEEKNQIQFTSNIPTETIVLEYISDGLNPDGTASVPVEAVECLIAWVHWKRLEFKKGVTGQERADAERRYIVEFNKLKHFKLMFTMQEYLDVYRSNVHGSPKR